MSQPPALRAVIYARFSSDLQRDASIKDQIRSCADYATRQGMEIVGRYSDRATSGASMMRPGLQTLLRDARAGGFDLVIAEALDRLSRNQADIATIYERLQFDNVVIETPAEGQVSELHIGLKGTMNALFLKDLATKTRRGLKGRALQGKSAGGLTYGYDPVIQFDAQGERIRGDRTINQVEAEIVRRIFRDYARGISPGKIAEALNLERIPGPQGGPWGSSTIQGNRDRGTGILNNELYIGRQIWNRLNYVKDPATGKRISRLNPESDWVITEVPDLRIIDDDLWQAVRTRQGAQKTKATDVPIWDRRRPKFLFSGLMTCGCCGSGYSKVSKDAFGCSAARKKGAAICSNMTTIRREVLEARVLDALERHLMNEEAVRIFCEEYVAERNRLAAGRETGRAALEQDLRQAEADHKALVDAIIAGVPPEQIKDRLDAAFRRKEALEAELAVAPAPEPLRFHPGMSATYRARVSQLIRGLGDADQHEEAKEALRALVEKIELVPEKDADGKPTLAINLHGALAGLLNLATGRPIAQAAAGHEQAPRCQKASGGEAGGFDLAGELVLVAGTGFEPVTFRL
ncbi:recombinase family protein [Paracoccus tibetensis]|uniref:recombinase family protein n=1 Tax=Paracoccus tibetensis TaxID=336292 RepID=UPI000B87AC0A|nr:recombinase family protein [Paracoccus tibetensis]